MGLLDVVFPQTCVGCNSLGPQICIRCARKMRAVSEPRCLSCGNVPALLEPCRLCVGRRESFHVLSCWYYEAVVTRAIWSLKYRGNMSLIAELCSRAPPKAFAWLLQIRSAHEEVVLVPVPLHKTRQKKRGYNQSLLLAQTLTAITSVPTETEAIVRTTETKPQARVGSKSERAKNTHKAFRLVNPILLQGKTIIVVDDVVTTGSTAKEVLREIRKAGVKKTFVFCLAREET